MIKELNSAKDHGFFYEKELQNTKQIVLRKVIENKKK